MIEVNNDKSLPGERVLIIQHLYKSFGNNHVLNDFNLELQKGESVVVLGKSGSGKSVMIKCVVGLLQPDKGTITMFGKNIPDLQDDELDRIRAKVGFLFQGNAPVSYTHLRAHETDSYLVCRLLLEKK